MNKDNMICYLYSKRQNDFNVERANAIGSDYHIGKIIAGGKTIEFTEVRLGNNIQGVEITHPDVEIVFQLDKDEVNYYRIEEPYIG